MKPWRSHYTSDWHRDPFVRGLSLEARMVYFELLDIAWEEGGLRTEWVTTGAYVAHRIGCGKTKFLRLFHQISTKFCEVSAGIVSNPRLETERQASEKFSEKQRNNVNSRYQEPTNVLPPGSDLVLPSQHYTAQHTTVQERERGADAPALTLISPGMDLGKPKNAAQRKVVDEWQPVALVVLDALNASRKRVMNSRPIRPTYAALAGICSRLEAGNTSAECLAVIENCEAEVKAKPESGQWFDQVSPWRADNFERKLAANPIASTNGTGRTYRNFTAPRPPILPGDTEEF